jgi:hypothetical protein
MEMRTTCKRGNNKNLASGLTIDLSPLPLLLCATEFHRAVSVTASNRSNHPMFNSMFNHSELRIEYPSE